MCEVSDNCISNCDSCEFMWTLSEDSGEIISYIVSDSSSALEFDKDTEDADIWILNY